jgi:hypothetical protein
MVFLSHKIGLVVRKPECNFTNGCVQQAAFIKELITSIGYECDYISIEEDFKNFPDTNEPVKFINSFTKLSNYKLFIYVSLHMDCVQNKDIIENIKKYDIKCINLICGNLFILHQEEFVFDKHHILSTHLNDTLYDEFWILEMYPFMTEYIKLLTGKPTYLLPYVWNDTIIKKYISKAKLDIDTDYHEISRNKINILIYEPNMSIHKTSLVPLLIAEKYQKQYGDKLHKVYVFCGNIVLKEFNNDFIQKLDIYKTKKIESYNRMIMPETIKLIKENNNYINVVVSHNIMNSLNFLHLEMMSLDIPIIHNCEPFKENQLYYDDFTMTSAVDMIEWVRNDFFINSTYRTHAYNIKNKFHPHTFERQETYKSHIERITQIYMDEDKHNIGSTSPLIDSFTRVSSFIYKQTNLENTLFYTGVGIIIMLSGKHEYNLLRFTLNNLVKIKNSLRVEIICLNEITSIIEVNTICKSIPQNYFVTEVLNLSNDTTYDNEPNIYMACVFSNFESGILIKPGSIFVTSPSKLIEENVSDKHNSFTFYTSYSKMNSLEKLDNNIHNFMLKSLGLESNNEYDLVNCIGMFYFNKKDLNCLKVLGTMCELIKLNKHLVDNVNILDIICKLNYGNHDSKIKTNCYVYGEINKIFQGYGLYYASETNEFEIMIANHIFNENSHKKIIVNCTERKINIKESPDKFLIFSGKVPAKKMPDKIISFATQN